MGGDFATYVYQGAATSAAVMPCFDYGIHTSI